MAQTSSTLKAIPELTVTRSTPFTARKASKPLFRLSGMRSSISLRELRTVPRRVGWSIISKSTTQRVLLPIYTQNVSKLLIFASSFCPLFFALPRPV